MASQDFQHKRLADPAHQIRLLEVVPSKHGDDLHCKITTHRRRRAPAYTAISYEWGDELPDCEIGLNGSRSWVRPNLWQCLYQLQACNMAQYYWVDALCIDQNNNEERNAQVSAMGCIYADAAFVVAWIGNMGFGSSQAIQFLKAGPEVWTLLYTRKLRSARTMSSRLASLTNRSYWRRVWVIQEILLASRVVVVCGKDTFDLAQLKLFLAFLAERDKEVGNDFSDRTGTLPIDQYRPIRDIHNGSEQLQRQILYSDASMLTDPERSDEDIGLLEESSPKIIRLLARHHGNTSCYDLRDKVYGMLGLVDDMQDFVVDYSQSRAQLYVALMVYLQYKHPAMPAFHVSRILQNTLCVQSHEHPVKEAVRLLDDRFTTTQLFFVDKVRPFSTVMRVGAPVADDTPGPAQEELEAIRASLGLEWTDSERSFSGEDFSESQRVMLARLATRGDMIGSDAFKYFPGPLAYACSSASFDATADNFKRMAEGSEQQVDSSLPRYFLTNDRIVGLACGSIEPGDIICQAYGSHAPMFAIRKIEASASFFKVVGGCYVYLLVDELEQRAAKADHGIDLLHIRDGQVPDTYWTPQVAHLQPVYYPREDDNEQPWAESIVDLRLDLQTLTNISSVPTYWIEASNEGWLCENEERGASDAPNMNHGQDRILVLANGSIR